MNQRGGWNPWDTLGEHPHVRLVWRTMRGSQRGQWQRTPAGETIILDPRSGRCERRAVLAHELTHLERGIGHGPATGLTMEREEAIVSRLATERLVPPGELEDFIARRITVEPITVDLVAEEFDVPTSTADAALRLLLLDQRSGRRRRP